MTYGDGGEEPLWDVGDDDADEEDDGVQPEVAEDEGDDEERDPEEDGHARDDVDEVGDLLGDGRFPDLQARRQVGDSTHHSLVSSLHHNARRSA